MFVVYIYAEAGDYDGQSFVAGPYRDEGDARAVAAKLEEFGQVDVFDAYGDDTQLVSLLREGRASL